MLSFIEIYNYLKLYSQKYTKYNKVNPPLSNKNKIKEGLGVILCKL